MATVVASSTTPNLDGISRAALFRQLALDTGLLFCGVATAGGDVATLYDTSNLKTSQGSPAEWIGGWLRISATTDNAAPEGEIVPISDYEPDLGKIVFEPHLTVAPDAGDYYELWKINPKITKDLLDQCLTKDLYLPCWTVLSEIPDHDMEQSHTTDWTASGATVTKQTAQPRLSNSGKRYLRVVSSAAGDYARSAILRIEPNRTYHASAVARCSAASTTAKLVAYDETNGAVIESKTSNRLYPARIWFTFQAPATCYSISLRLTNVEAGVTTEWDEVTFFSVNAVDLPMPWWVKNADQVKGVFQLEPLTITENLWDSTLRGEDDARFDTIPEYGGFGRFKAQARQGAINWPVFIFGARNETAYADDNADLKYLDPNLLCACLKYKLYQYHSQPLVTGLLDSENFKKALGPIEAEWMKLSQSNSVELNKTITSNTPWRGFLDSRFTYGEQ